MVTVGMNYDVIPGKEHQFETVFDKVLGIMAGLPGHGETHLFKAVKNPHMYLIVSKWTDRAAFDAFIRSDQFQKVADWGKTQILASRPKHEVYGGNEPAADKPAGGMPGAGRCPVPH